MPSSTVKVRSSQGGAFDCYLALPDANEPVPAMVLACAIPAAAAVVSPAALATLLITTAISAG